MPIDERMKLAEGRPLRRRMMAAMAQQDCGQCGYNRHDYSEVIASKAEARLNLSAFPAARKPRGCSRASMKSSTRRRQPHRLQLRRWRRQRQLQQQRRGVRGTTRSRPVFLSRRRLNKPGSENDTWYLDLDLSGSELDYVVGDSFEIFLINDPALADAVLARLNADPGHPIGGAVLARHPDQRRFTLTRAGFLVSS